MTWRAFYGAHHRPSEQTIRNVVKTFEHEFTLLNNLRRNRVGNADNVEAVEESVCYNPNLSMGRYTQQLNLAYGSADDFGSLLVLLLMMIAYLSKYVFRFSKFVCGKVFFYSGFGWFYGKTWVCVYIKSNSS